MGGYAWVTLATNDSYSLGALVLAHSLKKSKTAHKSVVLITPAVSQPMREQLQTVFDVIQVVDVLDSKDEAHLALMQRPELGITFTKIHCWKLVEFDKCVFLDADTLVVRNCDELFEREEFSAAPDVSWPDCFNSGVFVFKPSVQTFNELLQFAVEKGSFDGGDQGLLNQFFSGWATEDIKKHLPFVYNLTSVAAYSYIPAFKHYGSETRIVHFIGAGKPWLQQLDPATRTITPTSGSEHLAPLLQQWWDLFCEKVHPNLNKNLESNNDGMSHPPVAACSNSLPIALTDDSQTPHLIEPCTPYREKDDFRQYNLPYQPFDVKGSSGELLNVEFLLTSAARPRSPEVVLDEERREGEGEGMEEKGGEKETNERSENEEKEEKNDFSTQESDSKTQARSSDPITESQEFRIEERVNEWKETETEEQTQQQENPEQSNEPEEPPPTVHPFDYDTFFPDETCINKYLEQNVMTYQPYDSHSHHQQHQNQHHVSSENSISQSSQENSNCEIGIGDPQPEEDPVPSLPRFLTIPENDRRQSGNTDTQPEIKQSDLQTKSDPPRVDPPIKSPEPPPQQELVEEKRELTKSKSMPYLRYDVTEVPPSGSIWKSQPNVNVEANRKYSMPKLKPILPRQNSLSRSVPSIAPRVTLYTEFLMSSEYKDPADLPKDKVGFVETLIHRKGQLRRSKSAADIGDKFGPLPYNSSPETEQPAIMKKTPSLHLESELYDLSQCKRQMGNKPKAKDRRKESNHSLPALKPLVPPKDKKSTLIKKRKSKELSPGDGGREKIFKKEPKLPKERKRECRITPRNVSEPGTGNNVEEILTRLREFSKNYQHFFGVELQPRDKTSKDKQTVDRKKTDEGVTPASEAKETQGEKKSEKEAPTVDSKFTHFRNYVKEKSRTSQKGLLSIQDLVSRQEDEVGERLNNEVKVGDSAASAVKTKKDSSVEKETSGKNVNINREVSEGDQDDGAPCRILANKDNTKGNSEETVKSDLRSTEEVEASDLVKNSSNSSPAGTSESKVIPSKHSKENIPDSQNIPVVTDTGSAMVSCREGEARTNGLGEAKSRSEEADSETTNKEPDAGKTTEKLSIAEEKTCSEGVKPNDANKESDVGITTQKLEKLRLGEKSSCATRTKSSEDLELTNNHHGVKKTTEKTHSKPTKSQKLKLNSLEKPPPRSFLDGTIPNGNVCSEVSAEPVGLSFPEKASEECESKSSPKEIFSESSKQLTINAEGKLTEKVIQNSEAQTNGVKPEELPRKEELTGGKLKSTPKVLSDIPSSSATTENVIAEIVDEMLTKATLQKSQTSAPSRPTPRKTRKPKSPPKKPPRKRNTPPKKLPSDRPPDETSPRSSSVLQNGNCVPESDEDMKLSSGIAGAIAQLSLEAGSDPNSESAVAASTAHQEYLRRQNWETGNMDYMGRDSFDNIWSKICQTLEAKESEEAGPAAVSPKQSKEPSDPSATVPEMKTPEPPSTAPQKCPEYIETLPGEPAAGPVEDDEIIFSKPDNRQSCLTNITEAEEGGKESSALGAKQAEAGKVKLSDILQPGVPTSGPKEAGESGKGEAKTPVPTTAEKAGASADEKKEIPQAVKVQPERSKTEGQTAAKVQEIKSPQQMTAEKAGAPGDKKSEKPQEKPETVKVQPEASKIEGQTAAVVQEVKPSEQTTIQKAGAPADEKKEVPQAVKAQPEANKMEGQTAAKVQETKPPGQTTAEKADDKSDKPQEKPEVVKAQPKEAESQTAANVQAVQLPEQTAMQKAGTPAVQPEPSKIEGQIAAKVPEAKIPQQTSKEKAAVPGEDKSEKPGAVKAQPEASKTECPTAAQVQEAKTPQQTTQQKAGAPADEKKEVPQAIKARPETEGQTAIAASEFPQVLPGEGKPETCTTVAIPSPPIQFPGAPFTEKDKKGQSRRQPQGPVEEKFEPIPLPPPETPTEEPAATTSDAGKDQGKQKKGVFTKILEMVGVAPKEKSEDEISKSVFYDVEGAAKGEPAKEPEKQTPAAEVSPELKPEEVQKTEEAATHSEKGDASKPEETKKETKPPEAQEKKPQVKPPRNISPNDSAQSKNSIQITQKSRSPSPKLTLPKDPPATSITAPTPPPQPDFPLTKTSGLLKVDETIPETPPVPDPAKEATEESAKGKVLAEVEDIIGKAKTEVETRLQERRSADKETEDSSDLINTMKLMMGTDQAALPSSPEVHMEELKVTSEEDRQRHKGEVVSSKLSDQILKAIPPPRRKAISEGAASTSAIPKAASAPEQKSPGGGEAKAKGGKPSSIPVPPPRSRGKPTQPPPSKGKGKK